MLDPSRFDECYLDSRDRLLLQAYALTGDLPAARGAVRDAFVLAWHHWRKVSRLEDPEAWIRPHVWSLAQRRHTARIWHRDRSIDEGVRDTLAALAQLTALQRRLLMARISPIPLPVLAREVGVPLAKAEEESESATARFALHREIDRFDVPETLAGLTSSTRGARWPRPGVLRRAGTTRRRTHVGVAAVVVLVALVLSGSVVTGSMVGGASAVPHSLSQERLAGAPQAVRTDVTAPAPRVRPRQLLDEDQVARLAPDYPWRGARTTDNTSGDGMVLPCQRTRFADPDGRGSLVRDFRSTTPGNAGPAMRAVQMTELSASEDAAATAFATSRDWFSICSRTDVQIQRIFGLEGVGDEAHLIVLRSRSSPITTYTIGIARTGRFTTTVFHQVREGRAGVVDQMGSLLAAAVNKMCGAPATGACASPPVPKRMPPFPASSFAGTLATVDLPRVRGVDKPWVGTDAQPATVNVAATRCDNTDFNQRRMTENVTRSFLIPEASRLPATFGLTESIATMPNKKHAAAFIQQVRDRLAGCEEDDMTTTVRQTADQRDGDRELTVWEVTSEVSDDESVQFLMAVVRNGRRVAQLGFVSAPRATIGTEEFEDLAVRARARLTQPAAKQPTSAP